MRSSRPKPLHHLCGRPMVCYVLDAVGVDDVLETVVVVGHGATWIEKSLSERVRLDQHLTFVEQREQLGTGHAVSVALPTIDDAMGDSDGDVLIVPGDAPLLRRDTIRELLDFHRDQGAALTLLSATVGDPTGYGRVVRAKDGSVVRVVEERDATQDERRLDEINTAIMVVRQSLLGPALRRVGRQNVQNEYYLTDLVGVLHDAGHLTLALALRDASDAQGVNDRVQLAAAETVLRQRVNASWMARGVTMWDPAHTYLDVDVELAAEVSLLPGTVLKGHCVIARGAQIGPHAQLSDVRVGENAIVAMVEATNCVIENDAVVSSFVVLDAGARVEAGEFVEPFTRRGL